MSADPNDFLNSLDAGEDLGDAVEIPPQQMEDAAAPPDPAVQGISPDSGDTGVQAAAAAPAPAPAAPEPAPEPQKTVPLASLMEERAQWKRENEALQARLAAVEARSAAPAAPVAPPAPAPEWVEDPKAYVDAKVQGAISQLEATKNLTEQQQAELGELRLAQAVREAEVEVSARAPDWQDALTHLRTMRYQELKLGFPDATDQQILQTIGHEERQVAAHQLQAGKNPYDYAYSLAKLRGYTPRATTATPAPAGSAPRALPQVEAPRTLSPDTTLNTMSGSAPGEPEDDPDDDVGLLEAARRERFPRMRQA